MRPKEGREGSLQCCADTELWGAREGEFSTLFSVHAEALDNMVIPLANCLLPIQLILLERGSVCTGLATGLYLKIVHGCDYLGTIKQNKKLELSY